MPRKKSEITTTNNSQLFDYSQLENAEIIKEDIQVIKQNIEDISTKILDTGRRLTRLKNNLPHGQFLPTLEREFSMTDRTARYFMATFKTFGNRNHDSVLEGMTGRAIKVITSAMNNQDFDEETKEKILEEVKEQTKETGKALTEKEIKEITAPYLEQIQELREQVKEAKQGELFFQQKLDEKMSEVNSLKDTIDNQNKQIKELNSSISIKEQKLIDLSQKERELEEKEQLLAEQENSLNETIDDEVNNKLERLKQQELSNIEEEKQRLKDEQKKIQQELRKQKELAEALENQKQKFNDVRDWLKKIEDFNETLKSRSINILSTIKDIQNLPSFEQLGEDQKKLLFPRFSSAMNEFEKNSEAWGKAINNIYSALNKADREVVNLINSPIDVEVKNDG